MSNHPGAFSEDSDPFLDEDHALFRDLHLEEVRELIGSSLMSIEMLCVAPEVRQFVSSRCFAEAFCHEHNRNAAIVRLGSKKDQRKARQKEPLRNSAARIAALIFEKTGLDLGDERDSDLVLEKNESPLWSGDAVSLVRVRECFEEQLDEEDEMKVRNAIIQSEEPFRAFCDLLRARIERE